MKHGKSGFVGAHGGSGFVAQLLAAGSTLLNGLVSYWALDEVSGVRYDSVGENDLTDNNTVGGVLRGPKGMVASFVAANGEKLTRADTTGTFGNGVSRTISFSWKDTTAGTTTSAIIARDNATTREWAISTGNTQLFLLVFDSAGNPITVDSFTDFNETFAKNVWHHGVFWYDFTDSKIYYQVDGGTVRSKGTVDYVRSGTGSLEIGASTYYNSADLSLGPIGMWSRVLTADERTSLFNRGNGKTYEDLTAAEKTGLVSYWKLDETSGVRYDSHGSNDLTDNNTVGSVINAGGAMDGGAASFVAANSEMLTKSPLLPFDQSAHTIAGWARLNSMGNDIITYLTGNGGRCGVYVYTSGGKIALARYVMYDGGYKIASVNVDIPFNTWFFFVADADGVNARISVNNGAPGSAAAGFAVPDTNYPTVLGALAASQNYLDGRLDEVAIWDRVLTDDERAELYAAGAGKFYPFEG